MAVLAQRSLFHPLGDIMFSRILNLERDQKEIASDLVVIGMWEGISVRMRCGNPG